MTPDELGAALARGQAPASVLLAGDEPLLRDDALAALRRAVLADAPSDFNFDRLVGAQTTPGQLLDALRTLPVMARRRLVWLREPDEGRGGGKALLEALPRAVEDVSGRDDAVLVVTATKVDRRERWVRTFEARGALVDCAAPRGARELAAFARAEARRQGVSLAAGVAELLAERVGPQLLVLRQEIAKAALLAAPGTEITRAHAERSVVDVAEEPVWDLTDAIGEGRAADALSVLGKLLRAGTAEPVLLGTLASHFRKLARVRAGARIAAPPFVVKKLDAQARRYSGVRLLAHLDAIHQTDEALKGQGGLPPELALERLVLGLAAG